MKLADNEIGLLKKLVQRFRVCWEVFPENIYVEHEKRQIGYSLELYGTHDSEVEHPRPGCKHCQRIFAGLQVIAAHIVPRQERLSRYDIEILDDAIYYAAERRERPDVALKIKILHRYGYELPVDGSDIHCLNEMKQRLRELGVYGRE